MYYIKTKLDVDLVKFYIIITVYITLYIVDFRIIFRFLIFF